MEIRVSSIRNIAREIDRQKCTRGSLVSVRGYRTDAFVVRTMEVGSEMMNGLQIVAVRSMSRVNRSEIGVLSSSAYPTLGMVPRSLTRDDAVVRLNFGTAVDHRASTGGATYDVVFLGCALCYLDRITVSNRCKYHCGS